MRRWWSETGLAKLLTLTRRSASTHHTRSGGCRMRSQESGVVGDQCLRGVDKRGLFGMDPRRSHTLAGREPVADHLGVVGRESRRGRLAGRGPGPRTPKAPPGFRHRSRALFGGEPVIRTAATSPPNKKRRGTQGRYRSRRYGHRCDSANPLGLDSAWPPHSWLRGLRVRGEVLTNGRLGAAGLAAAAVRDPRAQAVAAAKKKRAPAPTVTKVSPMTLKGRPEALHLRARTSSPARARPTVFFPARRPRGRRLG